MTIIDGIPVWGKPDANSVRQIKTAAEDASHAALMADHHLGYSVPIGGVVAYQDRVSPSAVGYDIACGNKAILTDADAADTRGNIDTIMDDIFRSISFGVGRKNPEPVDHELFDDAAWRVPAAANLKDLARSQLGTVGSGNHYVDLFIDGRDRVWIGAHFGSRGLGHKLATHYIRAAGGKDGMFVRPALATGALMEEYLEAMRLAGRYAYAGRDWVCRRVATILGCRILEQVHNHHNFAWRETHFGREYWVVRKGATPAWPGQKGFVGGSMGDSAVIVEGIEHQEAPQALYSTVHGAGRVMSRTQAAGKRRFRKGRVVQLSEGSVSREMMHDWIRTAGVTLRGAGTDESPHCYKRLDQVLAAHRSIRVVETLHPIGVAMAAPDEADPYRD